jgi:GntR family transcriptional regulator
LPSTRANHGSSASALGRGRLPLSLEVAGLVRRRMEEGAWQLGEQLPTLEHFMAEYRVSRATMRTALAELEHDGLIERGRGKGTFMTGDPARERWLVLPTDWQGILDQIERLSVSVQTLESGAGLPSIGRDEAELASAYWRAHRLHLTAQAPYCLVTVHLERSLFRRHARKFEQGAVLPLLARLYPEQIAEARQTITLSTADVATSGRLQLPVGHAVADVRRLVLDHHARLIYLAQAQYPARHLRIDSNLLTSTRLPVRLEPR